MKGCTEREGLATMPPVGASQMGPRLARGVLCGAGKSQNSLGPQGFLRVQTQEASKSH